MSALISRPKLRAGCIVGNIGSHAGKSGVRAAATVEKTLKNKKSKKERKERKKWISETKVNLKSEKKVYIYRDKGKMGSFLEKKRRMIEKPFG